MTDPVDELADDAERFAGAVGLGRVAGKFLVGEVRVVLERTGRLDDVDAFTTVAPGQLAAPDRGVQRCGEVDVVHHPAGRRAASAARDHQRGPPEMCRTRLTAATVVRLEPLCP